MTDFQTTDMFADFGVYGLAGSADISTSAKVETRTQTTSSKALFRRMQRKAAAADVVTTLPSTGETLRIVSNGGFDFFDLVPATLKHLKPATMHACTWILNRTIAVELFGLIDANEIRECTLITGDYFRQRTPDAYGIIAQGFAERGMRFRTAPIHAKVMLIEDGEHFLTFEGSANWTNNTNVEQFCITNDRAVLEFHREWIEEIAGHG